MISDALQSGATASAFGLKTEYDQAANGSNQFLAQNIAVVGQGATATTYATTKFQATSAAYVGSRVGYGSLLHLSALQILPKNGDGVGVIPVWFYPLEDAESGVAATGDVTPSGAASTNETHYLRIGGVLSAPFTVEAGSVVAATVISSMMAAIAAVPEMPVVATDGTTLMDLEAKWAGASGNEIAIEVISPDGSGVSFAITDMADGATNPSVQPALDQVGSVWHTLILNCLNIADTTALNAYNLFGVGKRTPAVHQHCVVFTGNTIADMTAASAVAESRSTDEINGQLVAPGSPTLPCVVAARQLARIAFIANNNPPVDYVGQIIDGPHIVPGTDAQQWQDADRNAAIARGSSTVELIDGELQIGDVVTFANPSDEDPPGYRYVNDIVKVQNINHRVASEFTTQEWRAAPLVPDDQVVKNGAAKKPKMAKGVLTDINKSLGDDAIISDPDGAKLTIQTGINASDNRRLDMSYAPKLSGNTNKRAVTIKFSFYYGSAA